MSRLLGIPRRLWNSYNYDEMKLLAMVAGPWAGTDQADRPVLVDVGAHYGSSCAPYLELGWRVVAFEPDPANRSQLEKLQDRFPTRLTIVPKAVSATRGVASFYNSSTSTGISSLHSFHDTHEEIGQIETTPLGDALAEHQVDSVHVLKIDVEGHEMTALRSMDWSKQPDVLVCEFDESKTLADGPSRDSICGFLQSVGYHHITVSEWFPVIEYGQHHRPRRLTLPGDELPEGAWGNVIAFRNVFDQAAFEDRAAPLLARSRTAQPVTRSIAKANQALQRARSSSE